MTRGQKAGFGAVGVVLLALGLWLFWPRPVPTPGPEVTAVIAQNPAPAPEPVTTPAPAATPAPAPAAVPGAPIFEIVRVAPDGQTVIAGKAAPDAAVEVLLDGVVLDRVTTDATGAFVAIVQATPSDVARALTLRSQVAVPAPASTVPEVAPGGPVEATDVGATPAPQAVETTAQPLVGAGQAPAAETAVAPVAEPATDTPQTATTEAAQAATPAPGDTATPAATGTVTTAEVTATPADAVTPAPATVPLADATAPALATETPADAGTPAAVAATPTESAAPATVVATPAEGVTPAAVAAAPQAGERTEAAPTQAANPATAPAAASTQADGSATAAVAPAVAAAPAPVAAVAAETAAAPGAASPATDAAPDVVLALVESAPVIILPSEGRDAPPVVVQPGGAEVTLVQPQPVDAADAGLVLDRITRDPGGAVVLSGRGTAGTVLRCYANGVLVAETRIGAGGDWRTQLSAKSAKGALLLRLDALGADGAVLHRLETPFDAEDLTASLAPRPRDLVVQKGDNLWRLAEQIYGEGTRYSVIFAANANLIRDEDLIYPGQVFTLPTLGTPQ